MSELTPRRHPARFKSTVLHIAEERSLSMMGITPASASHY